MSIEQAHALLTATGFACSRLARKTSAASRIKSGRTRRRRLRDMFDARRRPFAPRDHLVLRRRARHHRRLPRRRRSSSHASSIADGVKPGDRVAIIMRNLPEWPVAFWGAVLAGAIVTPLNAWWTGPELEYGLRIPARRSSMMDIERYERIREHLPTAPTSARSMCRGSKEEIADPRRRSVWKASSARRGLGKSIGGDQPGRPNCRTARPTTMSPSSTPRARPEIPRAR